MIIMINKLYRTTIIVIRIVALQNLRTPKPDQPFKALSRQETPNSVSKGLRSRGVEAEGLEI